MENIEKLPYSLEIERALLGGILINQDFFGEIAEILYYDDFYSKEHGLIFAAMNDIYKKNKTIDPILVSETLKQKDILKLKEYKKISYENLEETLSKIIEDVTSTVNLISYAELIRDKSKLRKLINTCSVIIEDAQNEEKPLDYVIDNAEKNILAISNNSVKKEVYNMKELSLNFFNKSDEIKSRKGHVLGLPTNFIDLDKKLNGLNKSDLIILAARPAMGKTAFALNVLLNVAKNMNSVLFLSLEMPVEQIYNRFLAMETGIDLKKITNRNLNEEEWDEVGRANTIFNNLDIKITNNGEKILLIRSLARKLKSLGELDLIVLDYLQLMNGREIDSKSIDNRNQEIAEISRNLKKLAIELDIPIIALSQLSRGVESRQDKRPVLSDLRESGAIEQDADIVAFLYRDEYYHPESVDKGLAELIIAKHRNGEIGTIKFNFIGNAQKFTSYTDEIQ